MDLEEIIYKIINYYEEFNIMVIFICLLFMNIYFN